MTSTHAPLTLAALLQEVQCAATQRPHALQLTSAILRSATASRVVFQCLSTATIPMPARTTSAWVPLETAVTALSQHATRPAHASLPAATPTRDVSSPITHATITIHALLTAASRTDPAAMWPFPIAHHAVWITPANGQMFASLWHVITLTSLASPLQSTAMMQTHAQMTLASPMPPALLNASTPQFSATKPTYATPMFAMWTMDASSPL
jgi:hypothetical protein